MKSLLFVFAVMLVVVLVVGCNARQKDKEFDTNSVTTVVTPAEDEESAPLSVSAGETSKTGELVVTNLQNDRLETNKSYEVISGKTPQGTHKIKVNDYTLQRYRPGQTQWTYLAATRFGTLKEGNNIYTVFALDREGKEIGQTSFTIAYTPVVVPALPKSGNPLMLSLVITSLFSFGWYSLKRVRA